MPSFKDLKGLVWGIHKQEKIPPYLKWITVGTIDDKTIKLLFIKANKVCKSDILEWSAMIDRMNHILFNYQLQEKINLSLEEIGFEVEMVTMNP